MNYQMQLVTSGYRRSRVGIGMTRARKKTHTPTPKMPITNPEKKKLQFD